MTGSTQLLPSLEAERQRSTGAASEAVSRRSAPCTAEAADCTCPDFCERDHDRD
jgi:hypothetical protein